MVEQFLLKYFPPDKTAKYRASITGFRTDDDESLHAAWERYKSLLRRCPHHGLSVWLQVQTFFDAQSSQNKQAIDQIPGGDLGSKSPNEAFEVLEKAAKKNFAYNPPRSTPTHKGIHQVDSNTLVTAQLEALSKKFEQLQAELSKKPEPHVTPVGEIIRQATVNKSLWLWKKSISLLDKTMLSATTIIQDGETIRISAGKTKVTLKPYPDSKKGR